MSATTSLRNAMLGLVQSGHYIGLLSAVTNELAGSVTEINPASYARQAVAWGSIVAGVQANSGAITFPATTGSATYRYVGLYDAATGGTLKFVWDLGSNKTYDATNRPQFDVGNLTLDANRINL